MTHTEKGTVSTTPTRERRVEEKPQEDEYLTPAEAAKLLKLSTQTIRRLINEGELPAFKPSKRRWLILKGALNAWAVNKSMLDRAVTVMTREEDLRFVEEVEKELTNRALTNGVIEKSTTSSADNAPDSPNVESVFDAVFEVCPIKSDPSYGDALQETSSGDALQETSSGDALQETSSEHTETSEKTPEDGIKGQA